jgi:hypothetical protein
VLLGEADVMETELAWRENDGITATLAWQTPTPPS